jgi:hypothetical protein
MINWQSQQSLFEWDGGWRDLYILNTNLRDWQRLLDYVRQREDQFIFTINDIPHSLPTTIESIFAVREHTHPFLMIRIDHLQLNCHFFDPEQIEFDIDPREICDSSSFTLLLNCMTDIGAAVEKEVRLTPENAPDVILLRYNPSTRQIETP